MAGKLPGNPSQNGIEGLHSWTRKWYFSRQEIEDHSPSRKDGIDQERESHVRKLYCTFLQELGMELKVPQVTIATGIMLCHRFYMRQSLAKNDWQTVATASMFLACKSEETPRWLNDVVVVAYKLVYKWDPSAPRRIKQKDVFDKQKELVIVGERVVLSTVSFDLNIEHPYKPLIAALKRLEISQKELAKIAWNFVNDWLRTTLCLQHKPHYIAAGSLFIAAKLQKVKLPTEKGKVWWLQFDVSPKQLEEVIQQMLGLLEQNRKQAPPLAPARKVTEPKPVVGKALSESPESCILSDSVTAPDSGCGIKIEVGRCVKEPQRSVKEPLQTSECDSVNSVVEDINGEQRTGESEDNSSRKIVSLQGDYSKKIDLNRIRDALKRKRGDRVASKTLVEGESKDGEMDSEAWIERELESGIQSESASFEKKQRGF